MSTNDVCICKGNLKKDYLRYRIILHMYLNFTLHIISYLYHFLVINRRDKGMLFKIKSIYIVLMYLNLIFYPISLPLFKIQRRNKDEGTKLYKGNRSKETFCATHEK